MNRVELKNNKGFSLIELIVVMAIMTVAVGAVVMSSRILTGADAKQTAQKLSAELNEVKTSSMSRYGQTIAFAYSEEIAGTVIDSPGFYTEIRYSALGKNKDGMPVEVATHQDASGADVATAEHRKMGGKRVGVKIKFFDGSDSKTEEIKAEVGDYFGIQYNRNSGNIDRFEVNGTEYKAQNGCYIEDILLEAGRGQYGIFFDKVTGKHVVEKVSGSDEEDE